MSKTRFHVLLEERIIAAIEARSDSLSRGGAASFEQYKQSVGYIEGLREALTLCDDIEREFE